MVILDLLRRRAPSSPPASRGDGRRSILSRRITTKGYQENLNSISKEDTMGKRVFWVLAIFGLGLLGGGLSLSLAAEPIKIGIIQPLSGPVAYDGNNVARGAQIAVDGANAKGGALDRPLQLVIEDGQCVPAESVNAAEKLCVRDKVPVIQGAFCSSSTGAVMPIIKKYKIPLVTGISTSPKLTEAGNEYFFRAVGTSKLFADAFAKAFVNNLKIKRVAYLAVNDDWGRGSSEAFSKAIDALGGSTATIEIFDPNETNFYPFLTKIKSLNPDALYVVANTAPAAAIAKQIKEVGLNVKTFGEGAWTSKTFMDLAGPASEGLYGLVEYSPTITNDINKKFVEEFKKRHNDVPDKYSAQGYTVANIIIEAIQRAGASDPEKIRAALEKTNYKGIAGTYTFSKDKHQAFNFNIYLVQLRNRVPVIIQEAKIERPE
jgi:branched-chain amino acid transport system substrate-binding protein